MTDTDTLSTSTNTYWHGTADQAEIERLDRMHHGIKTYLDGNFFLAPLRNPQTILDIGAGSGIWAIDVAEKFPDAQVTAMDIDPMLPRPVPSNFQFRQLDILADPPPWQPSSFDVVHFRFLLIHLPEPQRVLERIIRLVKPGGWFIVEEVTMTGDVKGDAPAVRAAYSMLSKYWESHGQVPRIGEKLEPWLRQTGSFSEVNVREIIIPVGNRWSTSEAQDPVEGQAVDPKYKALGLTFTDTGRRGFSADRGMLTIGSTPELQSQCLEQFSTAEWRMDIPLHFVWARKSV